MELENSILPQLGRTIKFLDLYIEDELDKAGIPLTKMQFVFLKVIQRNGGQPQHCLAELTGRDKTTFTRNIKTLEKKDYVKRTPSQEDKRNKLVELTDHGRAILEKAKPVMLNIVSVIEADLKEEERTLLFTTLEKIRTKTAHLSVNHYNI